MARPCKEAAWKARRWAQVWRIPRSGRLGLDYGESVQETRGSAPVDTTAAGRTQFGGGDRAGGAGGQRPAVLLVDDDADARDLLRDVLLASGFRVTTARSGEAALAALELQAFDVVVTDLWLPGDVDGWELRRRMLVHPEWRAVPTVLTRVGSGIGPPIAHLAPAAIVNKPIDPEDVPAILRSVLGMPA